MMFGEAHMGDKNFIKKTKNWFHKTNDGYYI